ncbi:cobalamin biosynthesis protein [Sporosarcina sp. NCCP-2716]|uniref:adenosylcobinamide-phosphate synthase CbiB n=1 Tax=Sporosarcina sp. NCCP-2716 TaxID=2943679 RepID=UPI00203EEFF1|nr:adenosylcobinamide-phosphate synthase CbiB [Sporosarcina sp. NCCP-2716]GKV69114.1 cobalamin biosynthesis protein [Sporosarcina sp. NCCP-2716]
MDQLIALHLAAVTAGFLLDRLIGDPPGWPHPVRWIGTWISWLMKRLNRGEYRTAKGMVLLIVVVLPASLAAGLLTYAAFWIHPAAGAVMESVLIAVALAQKSLGDAAHDVAVPLAAGDLPEARRKLSWIVGRDTDSLDEPEITRGVVETVSENSSDGVTAPLLFAFLLGAPGIWLYKAVNTLDSMVGYKDERYAQFGTASARTDDVLNFIPARLTGLAIVLLSPNPSGLPLKSRLAGWRSDARKHPSPNSGWLEAATAWQLGATLGGTNTYRGVTSRRPQFGPGLRPLSAIDIDRTLVQLTRASWAVWALGILIGGLCYAIA